MSRERSSYGIDSKNRYATDGSFAPESNIKSAAGHKPKDTIDLRDYGWTTDLSELFQLHREEGLEAGRVVTDGRRRYTVKTSRGEVEGEIAGRLLHQSDTTGDLPVVGDWVALHRDSSHTAAIIHAVLPRQSKLSRNEAGRRTREQVVAANIDSVFLVMGLDGDFNLRRLERLLVAVHESGARPVVVLNKADLCSDPAARRLAAEATAPGVSVRLMSCASGAGLAEVGEFLKPRQTLALLGSSGVGKSSLINRLLGYDLMRTGSVRRGDDRGRHTTTHRQLVVLPGGALLIDSPGIRELQLWSAGDGLEGAFEDIETLAAACRFRDCTHRDEPGCAVATAIEDGRLDPHRLRNFLALAAELRALEIRRDSAARRAAGKKAQVMYRGAKKAKQQRRQW